MNKTFKIGSDPEFLFVKDGSLYNASNLYSGTGMNDEIGVDGHASTAELRPKAKTNPIEHFNEIEKNLKKVYSKVKSMGITTLAGSKKFGDIIGGHIHFGNVYIHANDGTLTNKDIVNILDLYLGLPLMMVEEEKESSNRKLSYGQLSDVRKQPHGFEYRTPSSWLVSRGITKSALCLAYTVMDAYLQNGKKIYNESIYRGTIDRIKFNKTNKKYYSQLMGYVYHKIKQMPLYGTYHKEINSLFSMIKLGMVWKSNADIFSNWGIKERNGKIIFSKDKQLQTIAKYFNDIKVSENIYMYGVSGDTVFVTKSFTTLTDNLVLPNEFRGEVGARGSIADKYKFAIGLPLKLRENHKEYNDFYRTLKSKIRKFL